MFLADPVTAIPGIGEKKAKLLASELDILTVEDMLYHTPRRYLDRSTIKQIKDCSDGDEVTISGIVRSTTISGFKKKYLQVIVDDGTGELSAIFFGKTSYLKTCFIPNDIVLFSGITKKFGSKKQMTHPEFDTIEPDKDSTGINTGRIIPLYPSTESLTKSGLTSRGFRKLMAYCIKDLADSEKINLGKTFPHNDFIDLWTALERIHFPISFQNISDAKKRLIFNENLVLHYLLMIRKKQRRHIQTNAILHNSTDIIKPFIESLPFTLTGDQVQALQEIIADMERPFPMSRLLQGDVGSGKTVVALIAAFLAEKNGLQTAIMAPTELLAQQHYATCASLLNTEQNLLLITSASSNQEKKLCSSPIILGGPSIIIGTHALFQSPVEFSKLGLVVIDEQHRFGVRQRNLLIEKGNNPHVLAMTATPIPRTLSLTVFGDMDVSSIKEKPPGRKPVTTLAFPQKKLPAVYNSLEKYVAKRMQVYYVLPLIEESEKLELKAVQEAYEELNKRFPDFNLAFAHGRMKPQERQKIMAQFKNGEINILISTTIIEVGVDVPNAGIIVIEHAERFGLSQLHQLRGRVGRGSDQSFCILIHSDNPGTVAKKRIKTIMETDDGFAIAEKDLELRGAGEFLGYRQHGWETALQFTELAHHEDIIEKARSAAQALVDEQAVHEDNTFSAQLPQSFDKLRKKAIITFFA